jgi:hypothetical protein
VYNGIKITCIISNKSKQGRNVTIFQYNTLPSQEIH